MPARHRDRERDRYRNHDRDPSSCNRGWKSKHVAIILLVMVVATFTVMRFGGRAAVSMPRQRALVELKRPKDLSEQVLLYGIEGGAKAGRIALQDERRNTLISLGGETVASIEPEIVEVHGKYQVLGARSSRPYREHDAAEARRDAMSVVKAALVQKLGIDIPDESLSVIGKPVYEPASEELRKLWEAENIESDRGWVILNVETSQEAVRDARAKQRLAGVGYWAGSAMFLLLIGYGFLRLDSWTKGYLTAMLGVVAIVLLGAMAAGLVLLRS